MPACWLALVLVKVFLSTWMVVVLCQLNYYGVMSFRGALQLRFAELKERIPRTKYPTETY